MQLTSLHLEVLPPHALEIWDPIIHIPGLASFYLAGGTALALQLGHRISVDLDFFTTETFDPSLPMKIGQILQKPAEIISSWAGAIDFSVNGVKCSLWQYHYPILEEHHTYDVLKMATPASIGLFKLVAIASRTTWKDIVDLYVIHQRHPLRDILQQFHKLAPGDLNAIYGATRNLLDEELLAASPLPEMLIDVNLEEARDVVFTEITKGLKQYIGN